MGDCTYVANNTKILNANIGKYCSIACDVLIGLGKHPVNNFVSTHPIFFSTLKQAQITFAKTSHYNEFDTINIGNDVWIGARAIIVDGISVGDGAIIGAGAVVTRNVPAYAIVGGVPAKIIKYRFTEKEIIYLQDFCWWDRDIKWLRDNHMILHDIKKFMSM